MPVAKDRFAGVAMAFALLLASAVGAGAGCAKTPPARCADEPQGPQQVQSDARVRVTTTTLPADPTAGGRLQGPAAQGQRPLRGVLLLDYSGSMFAGYDRPAVAGCAACKAGGGKRNGQPWYYADANFRGFLAALIDATTPASASVNLRALLFNKEVYTFDGGVLAKAPSTFTYPWSLSSMSSSAVAAALSSIPEDPFRGSGANANETHIQPAVARAVDALLADGDEGIIWLVTDNIADQSGGGVSAEDARRNLAFYEYLKNEPRLQVVYAYPIHDTQKCTWLCGSSLFAYALHVSKKVRADAVEVDRLSGGHLGDGAAKDDGLLWNSALRSLTASHAGSSKADLAGVPLRLKPMDLNAVSVSFEKTKEGKLQPLRCRKSAEFGDAIPCVATLVVKNQLRHERIDSAVLRLEGATLLPHKREDPRRLAWAGAICKGSVKVAAATAAVDDEGRFVLGPLDPGKEQKLQVRLMLPAVAVAPTTLAQMADVAVTDALLVEGAMTARVTEVHASLVVPPGERENVYGAASLPTIFTSRTEAEVNASFPVVAVVNNDGKLQALLLGLSLLGLLLIAALLAFKLQPAWCTALVDGVEAERYRMTRFSSQALDIRGVRYGRVKRGAGLPVFVPVKGAQSRRAGSAWFVAPSSGSEVKVELKQGWKSKKTETVGSGF